MGSTPAERAIFRYWLNRQNDRDKAFLTISKLIEIIRGMFSTGACFSSSIFSSTNIYTAFIENMTFRFYPTLPLILLFFLFHTQVSAYHEASEPSDGTVDSFRWLNNPLALNNVPIHDNEGKQLALSRFAGKIVLLNLWASWCSPCVRELPALDRLQQRLGGEDFVVVAVSLDSDHELARKMFNERLAIEHLKLYFEPAEQLGRFFPVDVLPASFIIDRKGQAMGLMRSYVDWDDPRADTLINRLVAGVSVTTLGSEKAQRDQVQKAPAQ